MKHRIRKTVLLIVVILVLSLVFALVIRSFRAHKDITVPTETTQKTTTYEDNKKLDEIRNRENIKRQQELIVQEVYLSEEKDRINREKEDAIKQFDAQIQTVEKKLEDVRAEKVSF